MPFSKLGLSDRIVQGILATGYTVPTTIQSRAIPPAVAGRDIIGCAQTGTGKTAAFVLPMLNSFINQTRSRRELHIRGLILTPTRELALQVEDFLDGYGRFLDMKNVTIIGGVNMEKQIKRLRNGADIVIATPGRLIDHINRKTINLSHVEILVLDEADRMFDMGFINDVRKIIGRIPAKRQTMLFSATISSDVKALVASIQKEPEVIEIGEQRRPAETVKQYFYSATQDRKTDLLIHILQTQNLDSTLIFSRTKHGADKLSQRLEHKGISCTAIHSNKSQSQRQRALSGFKQGQYKVLVATDIAARGIDVEGISLVVNFDTPPFAEDYIHRIGRTGRASMTGDAITLVSDNEFKYMKGIEKHTGRRFELKQYPGFDYSKKPDAGVKHDDAGYPKERRTKSFGGQRFGKKSSDRSRGEFKSHDRRDRNDRRTGSSGRKLKSAETPASRPSTQPRQQQADWKALLTSVEK